MTCNIISEASLAAAADEDSHGSISTPYKVLEATRTGGSMNLQHRNQAVQCLQTLCGKESVYRFQRWWDLLYPAVDEEGKDGLSYSKFYTTWQGLARQGQIMPDAGSPWQVMLQDSCTTSLPTIDALR